MRGVCRCGGGLARGRLLQFTGTLALAGLAAACAAAFPNDATSESAADPAPQSPMKIVVVTNVYALEWVVQRVGGEYVEVHTLETEVHDDNQVPDTDRELLRDAGAVIYAGNVAPEVQRELDQIPDDQRVQDIARLPGIRLLPADPELRDDALPDGMDPHVWLDPGDRMERIVAAVQRSLVKAAERDEKFSGAGIDFSAEFDNNAREVIAELRELHETLNARLWVCRNRVIVAEHPAYAYFAEVYGLEQLAISKPSGGPLDPEIEERQRERLRQEWQQETSRTIFLNRSREVSLEERVFVDKLANEFDARYRYLEPLEDGPASASDYIEAMEDNAEAVKQGLGCE